ncbi:hypothetical protein HBH56_104380 [Parastagonospora nodorum]|uniref:Uncharacterized protein n=1 Tax=Phaeosphaeria nodorum (strain SN15 / ATCC MYA-4574 / FGSC 10173) TaxID=321614 RepID=A0A7U2FG86_PHANO|nr:hypothetical protein HBH56_104380 [Parastagonospora nodorum]QRD04681.1 hypothetical protein JI435_106200 [Parastagonospora nodorum SN15]KAH3929514.1 hypothetical protein HBH54_126030 [Parastagonospora nodorum]KAH4137815.1 hypothetical protein HBH45_119780 [Parastagonospora nodorum]KAH4171976.1 hypothetical protein HBH44_029180 [Parastagonospora nodorum]
MASPPGDKTFDQKAYDDKSSNKEPSTEEPSSEETANKESPSRVPDSEEPNKEELPEEKPCKDAIPEENPTEDKLAVFKQNAIELPTKTSQSDDVVTMYNVIAKTIKAAKESAAQFQAIKDNTTAKMDALPINHLQMKNIKAASPRLVNITTALSLSIAQVMMMQDFEKTFRPEWKHKKKESVALREVFLKAKTKEIEKIQRDYKIETTKSLVGANMTILELEGTAGAG